MHFSTINNDNGSKVTKIAVVGLFHLVLAIGLIKATGFREIFPAKPTVIVDYIPEPKKPVVEPLPTPPEPVQKQIPLTPIDQPVIDIAKTPDPVAKPLPGPPAVVDTGKATTEPTITTGGGGTKPAVDTGGGAQGKLRTAVLADGCALPEYPARSARNNETGTVTLALLVSASGKVVESRIQTSSGYRDLDKAAQAALSMCKFKSATSGGVAEAGWSQIAYIWALD